MGNDPCYIQKFIFSKNRQESSDDRSDYCHITYTRNVFSPDLEIKKCRLLRLKIRGSKFAGVLEPSHCLHINNSCYEQTMHGTSPLKKCIRPLNTANDLGNLNT